MAASKLANTFLALSAFGALAARVALGARAEVKEALIGDAASGECEDKDAFNVGITNKMGWSCAMYTKALCVPRFDTEDFKADEMCCVCGGGYRDSQVGLDAACAATCHGYTCDEWVNNGGGNTCEDLERNFGCDCAGCLCGTGEDNGQYPQDTYNDAANYDYVDYGDEDSRPQIVDPRSNYWSAGSGYCADADGNDVAWYRIPGLAPGGCAYRCNEKSECLAYATDEMGCMLYYEPVAQGNNEDGGYGCFVKAIDEVQPDTKQNTGHKEVEIEVTKVSGNTQELQDQAEETQEWKGENTVALNPASADDTPAATPQISYKPLGAVDPNLAQVFVWIEKQGTFFLKQRFEPPSYCVDSNEQCQQWAEEGWCTVPENSEWMMANCRFSCAACAPVIQESPNHVVATFKKKMLNIFGTTEVTLQGRMYHLTKPHAFNLQTTWRVTFVDGTILFSIQKGECIKRKNACDETWQIFQGRTSAKKVLYFGIQRTSTFKWYRSLADFKKNPKQDWRAEVRMLVPSKKEPATHKVTVMPNEDAGLILMATYLLNQHKDLVPDRGTSDTESNGPKDE